MMTCVAGQAGQVAGVSQFVEVHDGFVMMCEPVDDEIRANEAHSARYEAAGVRIVVAPLGSEKMGAITGVKWPNTDKNSETRQ